MNKKLLWSIFLGSVFCAQAIQWQPIGTFKQGDILGYLAKSPDSKKVLFIVCFPLEDYSGQPGNYSGQVRVEADVFPMDNRGQNELKEKFKKLALLWEEQQIKKLKAHL